jgi:Protein phosphatase 2C
MSTGFDLLRSTLRRLLLAGSALGPGAHIALAQQAPKTVFDVTGTGVSAVSYGTYAANDPIEDRFFVRSLAASPNDKKMIGGILDGHGGWQASEFTHRALPKIIGHELANAANPEDPEEVARALIRSFERADREFIDSVRGAFKMGFGEVAKVGCCALTAVVTPKAIVVANAGDCRAVYGQIIPSDVAQQHAAALQLDESDTRGKRKKAITEGQQQKLPSVSSLMRKDKVGGLLSAGYGSDSGSGSNSEDEEPINLEGGAVFALPVRKQGKEYKLWAVPLSHDHNARIPREVARLQAARKGSPPAFESYR